MLLKGKYLFSPTDEYKKIDLANFPSVLKAFERRIQGWFFNPLENLLVHEENLFVASAVECMLIDVFSGFSQGIIGDTHKENFTLFLRKKLNIEEKTAEEFYARFRCGILHQTNIKKNSSITDEIEDLYLQEEDNVLFFNPRGFYRLLHTYFKEYMKKIVLDNDLQIKFRTRFYHLFRDEFVENKWEDWFREVDNYQKDIRKSIETILRTWKGTNLSDPNYGISSDLWIFEVWNKETRHMIESEVKEAIASYEPRIEILNVGVELTEHACIVDITYRIKSTGNKINLRTTIDTF